MPSPKLTAAGCPRFTGTVFKDYLDNDFKMCLRREGIARVLDATKDPRKLYIMPAMPAISAPETPVTVASRASARSARAHAPEESSPKTMFAQERFEQSVRTERRVKPDARHWLRPLSKLWYFIYDDERRRGGTFGDRRSWGYFVGFSDEHLAYRVYLK